MAVPKVPQVLSEIQEGLSQAAQVLGEITETINAVSGAPRDVNAQPITPQGVAGAVSDTLQNVRRAGELRQMLPFVFVAGGFLLGKPILGIALAVVVHLAGKDATPAPAGA